MTQKIIEVSRPDLAWALTACLPHVGSKARQLDWVGFTTDHVYSTDHYTVGVAHLDLPVTDDFALPLREAKDLLKFVRPTLVKHQTETVQILLADSELHCLLQDGESEVYGVVIPETTFEAVYGLLRAVRDRLPANLSQLDGLPFLPDFAARFAKAQRTESDRLTLYPRENNRLHPQRGASYVTVGSRFEGAISGLAYEEVGEEAA